MVSTELIYAYRWQIGITLIGLLLLSRYIMRRLQARRDARRRGAAAGEAQVVTDADYQRARKRFLASLALLAVIIVVAVLTRFR